MPRYLLIPLILFIYIVQSFSGDRMVLVERFTSSTCPPCASNNPIMDAFLASQDPERITGLSYHMSWPAPGNDPMYLHNPADNDARRNYYGVNSIPQARMDGTITINPAYNQGTLQSYFDSRKDILSPLTIIVRDTTIGDSVKVFVKIYCEAPIANPNVYLYLAVLEKHIHYNNPPGTNGETDFYDVMRKMLPNGNGQQILMTPGQVYQTTFTYYIRSEWQASQLRNLVFVQTNLKELLNAAMETPNFTLTMAPAFRINPQGQAGSGTYYVKTPYIANGYNSPVTFTAAVDPPNSGITVTFPNGNTLSNFNDSIQVNVTSNSSVPVGEYSIVITGTNTSNKVHKTSAKYLVGKNYILTGANRSTLKYKIDNVEYNYPKFFIWDIGSAHNLAPVQPQSFGSTRFVFHSWQHGGDSVQTVTIGANPTNYIINYKIQFKLITNLNPAGIPVTVNGGNLYYDSTTTASLSPTPLEVQYNNKTYWFQRWEGTGNGSYTGTQPNIQLQMHNVIIQTAFYDTIAPIGIKNIGSEIPAVFALHQNYPNPFNPVTNIKFDLPKQEEVSIVVYDIIGNEVAALVSQPLQAGYYEVQFNATNLASGVYLYRIKTNSFTDIKKLVVVK
jgi:hypothetical protein